ncbi:MAG TPA: PIG-L family deacetylase [Actinomycetota bacterium]|nr:PIG-L family deacetylase [Actinomycetota bacterium]
MGDLGTILGVWAHPDDETYLTAGIMATAVRNGQRVVCVTATKGEAGSQDEVRWPSATIAEVREKELAEALSMLGVTEHHWLGYIDGRCHEVDDAEPTAKIRRFIEEVQPDTVLTFGPDGDTGHLDHIAVSRWTTAAFDQAAKPGAKLYYPTVTPEWEQTFVETFRGYNVYGDRDDLPTVTPKNELGIDFPLGDELLKLKFEALAVQASQTEGLLKAIDQEFFRSAFVDETFRVAASKQ